MRTGNGAWYHEKHHSCDVIKKIIIAFCFYTLLQAKEKNKAKKPQVEVGVGVGVG